MKYSEIDSERREHVFKYYLEILLYTFQVDLQLGTTFFKFIIVGNAAAAAIVLTFVGIQIEGGKSIEYLILSASLFASGAFLIMLLLLILLTVNDKAVLNWKNNIINFVGDNIDVSEVLDFGLTPRDKKITASILWLSLLLFILGIIVGLNSLSNIALNNANTHQISDNDSATTSENQ